MNFERGKDPRSKMEIGHTATAPIVYRLLIEDFSLEESFQDGSPPKESHVIGLSDDKIKNILRNIKYYPQSVHNYYVEFTDKEGRILSTLCPLSEYSGKVIQYRGELFLIPEV